MNEFKMRGKEIVGNKDLKGSATLRYSTRMKGYFICFQGKELFLNEEQFWVLRNKGSSISYEVLTKARTRKRFKRDLDFACVVFYLFSITDKVVRKVDSRAKQHKGQGYAKVVLERKNKVGNNKVGCVSEEELERARINRQAGLVRGIFEWYAEGEKVLRRARGDKEKVTMLSFDNERKKLAKDKVCE